MLEAYEMMYILRPNLLEEQINEAVNKYRNLLAEQGATDIKVKFWGRRRLAYPIAKHQEGVYILMYYRGDGKQVAIVERAMRFSEEVIRYLTLKIKEIPDIAEDSFQELAKTAAQPPEAATETAQTPETAETTTTEVVATEVATVTETAAAEEPTQSEVVEA